MKLFLLLRVYFLFFMLNVPPIFAQNFSGICATEDNQDPDPPGMYSYSSDLEYLQTLEPTVVNIYFWRIGDQFGNIHPWALTEQKALESVQHLNINFNPIGIFFKYRGMDHIISPADVIEKRRNWDCNSCEFYPYDPIDPCNTVTQTHDPDSYAILSQCQISPFLDYANQYGHFIPDAINVYVPHSTTDFGGYSDGVPSKRIIVNGGGLTGGLMLHEVGHLLGLNHTFAGWYSQNTSWCEHVTRDPNNNDPITGYNAATHGDAITDTPAQPQFSIEHCVIEQLPLSMCGPSGSYRYEYYDTFNCEYVGTVPPNDRKDCAGTPYEINPFEESRNYMAYTDGCADNFTIGQGIKMKEILINHPFLAGIQTTISSLYEPYKGEYYVSGPESTIDPQFRPLFQPGFNYRFVECECDPSCDEPAPYEDTSFSYTNNSVLTIFKEETNFNNITHPNHTAIQIDFINPLPDSYLPTTRRCYDNWNGSPFGGSVTEFNDGVFNTNVTIYPQDSTGINNPNLVNDLNPGLYKIEKNYIDGATQQTIILKDNN